jgi:serine O-acetyltransferase
MFEQLSFLKYELKGVLSWSPSKIFYALFDQGVWALVIYRLSRALFLMPLAGVRIFARLVAYVMHKVCELLFSVSIPPSTSIGRGLYIGHGGPIYIHPDVHCGEDLKIGPGVVIGQRGMGAQGVPTIGDDVYVGVGAKILGKVTVGSTVRVGANSVIVQNVPDAVTVFGVPARVVGPVFGAKRKVVSVPPPPLDP